MVWIKNLESFLESDPVFCDTFPTILNFENKFKNLKIP